MWKNFVVTAGWALLMVIAYLLGPALQWLIAHVSEAWVAMPVLVILLYYVLVFVTGYIGYAISMHVVIVRLFSPTREARMGFGRRSFLPEWIAFCLFYVFYSVMLHLIVLLLSLTPVSRGMIEVLSYLWKITFIYLMYRVDALAVYSALRQEAKTVEVQVAVPQHVA